MMNKSLYHIVAVVIGFLFLGNALNAKEQSASATKPAQAVPYYNFNLVQMEDTVKIVKVHIQKDYYGSNHFRYECDPLPLPKIPEPKYEDMANKYPYLAKRHEVIEKESILKLIEEYKKKGINESYSDILKRSSSMPSNQMHNEWMGSGNYYETDLDGKNEIRSKLGRVFFEPYDYPLMGMFLPEYKQVRADLSKPHVFFVEGMYYSVYGDCQVAKHVRALEDHPDNLVALRYAGNPIYAESVELPPVLQSCGVDGKGQTIWLADMEGHVTCFRTGKLDYLGKCATFDGATRILIPRNMKTMSVFAFGDKKETFIEYGVDEDKGTGKLAGGTRSLPLAATHVLYCDDTRVIYLTAGNVNIMDRDKDNKTTTRTVAMKVGATAEKVWEALYDAKSDRVCLLVGPTPNMRHPEGAKMIEYAKLGSTHNSWRNMRVLIVPLSETKYGIDAGSTTRPQ